MSKTLATKAKFSIAKTYGASATMSAVTNASEAVATLSAGHGCTAGDYIEVTSGWSGLDGRILRVKTVSTNDVTLEGFNSTSTTTFPAGSGIGSVRRISAWDQLSQLKDVSTSGGERQYTDATTLDDDREVKVPTINSAMTMNIDFFDDPSLAWYATVAAASDTKATAALKIEMTSGAKIVANAYWGLNKMPSIKKNELLASTISLSFAGESTRYSS